MNFWEVKEKAFFWKLIIVIAISLTVGVFSKGYNWSYPLYLILGATCWLVYLKIKYK